MVTATDDFPVIDLDPVLHDVPGTLEGRVAKRVRWTNDVFRATPHRAVKRSGGERCALAFFCDSQIDWPVAAVPTTVGPDRPPKYPTTWYTDYMVQYQKRTYDLLAGA